MPPLPDTPNAPAASDPAPLNGPLPRHVGLKAAALLLLQMLQSLSRVARTPQNSVRRGACQDSGLIRNGCQA